MPRKLTSLRSPTSEQKTFQRTLHQLTPAEQKLVASVADVVAAHGSRRVLTLCGLVFDFRDHVLMHPTRYAGRYPVAATARVGGGR